MNSSHTNDFCLDWWLAGGGGGGKSLPEADKPLLYELRAAQGSGFVGISLK